MMFGGSPISVAVPPMFEASAPEIRNGIGSTSRASATKRVTGAISSTVVTLSSRALSTAVTTAKITRITNGSPRPNLALLIAMYSKSPVGRMMLMMTIIEISRKITFQSTPNSSRWNASCWSRIFRPSIRPAPAIATMVLWIFSEMITA